MLKILRHCEKFIAKSITSGFEAGSSPYFPRQISLSIFSLVLKNHNFYITFTSKFLIEHI